MKSAESIDMVQSTALVAYVTQKMNGSALRLGVAVAVLLFGVYLYLVPNSITVSFLHFS